MRYLCVHGHCYQPPREDPWLDEIERQPSAAPYHDWNERITAECYTPNTAARILDERQRIAKIVNNYSRTSFDFGPTLLAWLERKVPATYDGIRKADRASRMRFSGHGSAIAQAYNHMIMPLAHRRDKITQVLWGIQDFRHRFEREPEGMWLPETAVDLETLDIMAEQGIKFSILGPRQARAIRPIASEVWQDVSNASIDPAQPYLLRLPSGRSICVFFFDGPVSQAVSFEGVLENGEKFIARLLSASSAARRGTELVHVVTDGELYGHHQKHGEMALAYTLEQLDARDLARITNYGEYLELFPPAFEVDIIENTSWSCAHGLDRWRKHCGCNAGHSGWSQHWRESLRNALDWLRDTVAVLYERAASEFAKDPWAVRDNYIQTLLEPGNGSSTNPKLLHLLELQRQAMFMYTSCGWFFDEISGIETIQVIRHAARVIDLAQSLFRTDLEPRFLNLLRLAKSNLPEYGDGARIYLRFAKPLRLPRGVETPRVKHESAWCEGLGILHRAIRRNHLRETTSWARPCLENAGPLVEKIVDAQEAEVELAYARDSQQNGSFLRFLREQKIPLSGALLSTAERALNSKLRRALTQDDPIVQQLLEEANSLGVHLDQATRRHIAEKADTLVNRCAMAPHSARNLAELGDLLRLFPHHVWAAQNLCYALLETHYPATATQSADGDADATAWLTEFHSLCDQLQLSFPGVIVRHAAAALP